MYLTESIQNIHILDLNKEQERELNIRLNKNTGEFDMDILANEFDIDELVDWGFKHIDLDVNIDKIVDEDNSATITIKEDDEIKAQELYNDLKKQGYNVKIK